MDWVRCDPSLVEQILRNLVANAIKYTREGLVRLRCLHDEAAVRIQVLDTGIGIPSEQLPHIYDEFYQVGVPANTVRGGYGLGLSIVLRLVKLLNLRLQVESEVGRGSVFSLQLPASVAPSVDRGASVKVASGGAQLADVLPHILVVEDDRKIASFVVNGLKQNAFAVDHCANGEDALAMARSVSYDAAVVDIMLPELDGLTLVQTLRKDNIRTPVLILSAKATVDDRIKGLQAGGDGDTLVESEQLGRDLTLVVIHHHDSIEVPASGSEKNRVR